MRGWVLEGMNIRRYDEEEEWLGLDRRKLVETAGNKAWRYGRP
jgi:hypothetical protein